MVWQTRDGHKICNIPSSEKWGAMFPLLESGGVSEYFHQ